MVGQPLEHVADIDDERALGRLDRQPLAVAVEQFEPRFLGTEQEGDEVDVLMRAGAHAFRIGGDRRIMEQPQDRIAILHRRVEPVGGKPQMARDRRQDHIARAVERGEQLGEGVAEPRGPGGPDVGRHHAFKGVASGQRATDVPEFLQVDRARALGDLGLEGGIAALPAALGVEIAALLAFGQVEERLGLAPGPVDQIGGDAVIGDDGKAETLERGANRGGKAIGVVAILIERQRGNLVERIEHGVASERVGSRHNRVPDPEPPDPQLLLATPIALPPGASVRSSRKALP